MLPAETHECSFWATGDHHVFGVDDRGSVDATCREIRVSSVMKRDGLVGMLSLRIPGSRHRSSAISADGEAC